MLEGWHPWYTSGHAVAAAAASADVARVSCRTGHQETMKYLNVQQSCARNFTTTLVTGNRRVQPCAQATTLMMKVTTTSTPTPTELIFCMNILNQHWKWLNSIKSSSQLNLQTHRRLIAATVTSFLTNHERGTAHCLYHPQLSNLVAVRKFS